MPTMRAVHFDEFAYACDFFTSDTNKNNGYGCTHTDPEKDEPGCCFCWACPLGFEAEQEDMESPKIEWGDEDPAGEVAEVEYIIVRIGEEATKEEKQALRNYDRYIHRYDYAYLAAHPMEIEE